jgi:predicted lipoprotein with Yx(FWY)xxD motif
VVLACGGGCGGGTSASPSQTAAPAAAGAAVDAKKVSLGTILVDGKGMTLYLFEMDKGGKSACYGACATAWPPLLTGGKVTPGSGVNASWVGTTTRSDGKTQVTYHGWPLYYFVPDKAPGEIKGQDLKSFGAPWYSVGAATGDKLEK